MMELPNKTAYGQLVPALPDPAERRNCPRFPFSCAVEATDILSNTRLTGRITDISRNGCYVDTLNPFPQNSMIAMTITKNGQSFKTKAKVVYSKGGMGMGILFTTADPGQLDVLGSWLSELSGEKVIEHQVFPPPVQPKDTNGATGATGADQDLRKIVGDLVALLNGKNILSDSEGMALLRKLSK